MVRCWYDLHGAMLIRFTWYDADTIYMVRCWYDLHGTMLIRFTWYDADTIYMVRCRYDAGTSYMARWRYDSLISMLRRLDRYYIGTSWLGLCWTNECGVMGRLKQYETFRNIIELKIFSNPVMVSEHAVDLFEWLGLSHVLKTNNKHK